MSNNVFAKIEIRENVLKELDNIQLLEVFAGDGKIYNQCYQGRVNSATGIESSELMPDCGRKIYRGKYKKILRTMDIAKFNLFDINSSGSPWYPFWIICNRLRKSKFDKIGFVLIENKNDTIFDKMEIGMKKNIGINKDIDIPKLSRHRWYIRELLTMKALHNMNYKFVKGWRSTNLTKKSDYMGFVVEKNGN